MSKKRKLMNILDICRFCLNEVNNMVDLSTPEIQEKVKAFSDSTSITIEHVDYLPNKICHVCVYKLESWYEFKQQLINSYEVLIDYLKESGLLNGPDDDVKLTGLLTNVDNLDGFIKKDQSNDANGQLDINLKQEIQDSSQLLPENRLKKLPNALENNLESSDLLVPKVESTSEGKIALTPGRNRPANSVRRTSEQRLASTQRWAARKRALLAATGQNESDTDSIGSDTAHLSPMKKARVKCNDKDTEKWKSDPLTASDKDLINNNDLDEGFKPQTVQSEVKIGDTTFVVTSTLFLSEPYFINQPLDNLKGRNNDDTDQNMDIIDALQLRRVGENKLPNDKMLEKCLNIEVEGTELEALQKVQLELASFVETEIEKKLCDHNEVKHPLKPQDSFQTLEQQLKIIVEKAIKKNIDNNKTKRVPPNNLNRKNNTFPSTFIKAATKSSIFQPKVIVDRLDPKVIETLVKSESESDRLDVKENLENGQDLAAAEKHICGICGFTFSSKALLDEHVVLHKPPNNVDSTKKIVKRKLMRCKRCHEIVDAELVKFHICRIKNHPCKLCKQVFKAENLLKSHEETHHIQVVEVKPEKVPNPVYNSGIKKEINCFICDKIFDDDEKLKDHLQNHCDDNEDSNSTIKDIFQCAICGTTVDSEPKLEYHVEQHLFNDDDNPNMIDISTDKQKDKLMELHSCVECNAKFKNEIKLALHMQEHEEDAAIAEWEHGLKIPALHACTICDDTFDNEQDLADHFDVHNSSSHICVLCDKPFITLLELQEHVNIH